MKNVDAILKLANRYFLRAVAQDVNIKAINPSLYYRMKDFANRVSAKQVDIHVDPSDPNRVLETKIKDDATSAEFYKQFAKDLATVFMGAKQEFWSTVVFE